MLAPSSKRLVVLFLCIIPIISFLIYFRIPTSWSTPFSKGNRNSSEPWALAAVVTEDTEDLADQHDIFDSTLEGGARIRQACMFFGSSDATHVVEASVAYERSMKTHLKHAAKWGYPSHILRQDIIGHGKWEVLVFGKLLYLQSIIIAELTKPIGKRAGWIVWFDADTIILNDNIPWSMFLPPVEYFNDIHFLGNKDWNGYNCGVFMMRINEWSVNFLTQATALPLLRPDVPLGVPAPNMEQDAMKWVLDQEGYKEHAIYQPRSWYNGFAEGLGPDGNMGLEIKPGDLLVHFAGSGGKSARMGHWLDILDNEPEKVNIPLANLTLHNDVKDFWAYLRTARQALHEITECLEADTVVQQVFLQHPELGDDLEEASKEMKRVVYEEPFHENALREATQRAEAVLSRASEAKEEIERHEAEREEQARAEAEKGEQEEEKKKEEEQEARQNE